MSNAIKTIIFDLSEVLIYGLSGVEQSLAPRVGGEPAEVLASLGGDPLLRLCRGELSEDAYLEGVISNTCWKISTSELKRLIRDNFSRKVDGMEPLLEALAARYELVLLSDHAREWVEHIHELHPHLRIFRTRVYSFQIGQTKRDPSTFKRLLRLIDRRPEECVFIDDNIINIESAQRAGIKALHFNCAEALLADLQKDSLFCSSAAPAA